MEDEVEQLADQVHRLKPVRSVAGRAARWRVGWGRIAAFDEQVEALPFLAVHEQANAVLAGRVEDQVPEVDAEGQHRVAPVARTVGADARRARRELLTVRAQQDEPHLVVGIELGRGDAQPDDEREVRVSEREGRAAEPADAAADDRELRARAGPRRRRP